MTKREVLWLIVKIIGVYFIYQAVISAWSFISTIFAVMSMSANVHLSSGSNSSFLGVVMSALAIAVFHGWLGWYLIKDGSLLFAILNREEPPLMLRDFREKD